MVNGTVHVRSVSQTVEIYRSESQASSKDTAGNVRERGGQLGIRKNLKDTSSVDNRQDYMTVSGDVL